MAKPMSTVHEVVAYLDVAIAGFVRDPADSAHQEGYLEALKETKRVVLGLHHSALEAPGKSVRFDAALGRA